MNSKKKNQIKRDSSVWGKIFKGANSEDEEAD